VLRAKEAKDFVEAILSRMLHPGVMCNLNVKGRNPANKRNPEEKKLGLVEFNLCNIICGAKHVDFESAPQVTLLYCYYYY
jgi:hypothetical protein